MFKAGLHTSLERIFPASKVSSSQRLVMDVAQNEFFSCQAAVRMDPVSSAEMMPDPFTASVKADPVSPWEVRIRRVGYVPMRHRNTWKPAEEIDGMEHIPGFVPDPLFEEQSVYMPFCETHAFWLSFHPRKAVKPGRYKVGLTVSHDGGKDIRLVLEVRVHPVKIRPRRDFSVINWFYTDSLLDYYKCEPFDSRFWSVLPAYLQNLVSHGQDTVYVPVFTPPLDGVKRPTQLLAVREAGRGRYRFDWRDVKRFIRVARECGIRKFEWTHLFTQWGAKYGIRIYRGQGLDRNLLWDPETPATGRVYRNFLEQFLPELKKFLDKEGLTGKSMFHLSDEPHEAEHQGAYRQAREMLREIAPWMKVMDALSDARFAGEGLVDTPVCTISGVQEFIGKGMPVWCYFCCQPRGKYLNRMMDDSLAKIRMSGWLFYRWPLKGFLHWGYNYWHTNMSKTFLDPFQVSDGGHWPGWPYGDPFMVYPGEKGPLDSIRWEVFAESLQDYALLQTVCQSRDSSLMKQLRSFEEFPRDEKWIRRARLSLLSGRRPGKS